MADDFKPVLIYDECVAGDTLISTEDGLVKIQNLNPGTLVKTPIGLKMVLSTIRRENPRRLMRVKFTNGDSVYCTDNHRFLSKNGWVSAKSLSIGEILCFDSGYAKDYGKAMRALRENVDAQECPQTENSNFLREEMFQLSSVDSGAEAVSVRTNEDYSERPGLIVSTSTIMECEPQQLHVQKVGSDESVCRFGGKAIPSEARRKRQRINSPSNIASTEARCGMEAGIRYLAGSFSRMASDDRGLSPSSSEDCSGMRWIVSQPSKNKSEGCEEGYAPKAAWVEDVEIQEIGRAHV